MQDLVNEDRTVLSLDEFNEKFGLKTNFLQYFQITAAIPSCTANPNSSEFLFLTPDLLCVSAETTLSLYKIRCKHSDYYKLFLNECSVSDPTGKKYGKNISQTVFLTGEAYLSSDTAGTRKKEILRYLTIMEDTFLAIDVAGRKKQSTFEKTWKKR